MQNDEESRGVQTLRWRSGLLEMIDQRVLPARIEYLAYDSAAGVAEGIRTMVVRGAPAIGCAAAYGVALEALRLARAGSDRFARALDEGFDLLAASRPTAVNLFWALERMRSGWARIASQPPAEIAAQLLALAHEIAAEDVRINRAMGAYGADLLPDGSRVLTHCNAGALATAGHGTALGVIRSARDAGKRISVIADETRPFLQGARLTAWEMVQEGIPVTLITDGMAGFMMSRGEVDAVIVGTDRVAGNGDVANKIGTYMVALAAQRHGVPFYVACPLSTIDRTVSDGAAIPIEERAADEVTGYRECRWAAQGVSVRNPAFDVTPAELVTALITEKGVLERPSRERIEALFFRPM
ncbi:S-methyl-5-thioribose-1-phosphate isomerase [Trinickia caryophylli]|uniref:Methylthioribose-1-phosphate isomerase n=1 Tax=Trinickia caryophylli TaxID=28094 RepID=A0A1X7CP33_TRICW|nr:S-methyl-5-thioribose-1-phosphate isomerase [Trinickia caryophylli]PMS11275.1 S-methyl-5-thioribose-1-phosphate isomerase [Trinickia caryophylli]TRX20128.1 S-methyl-5-thioribose-1-phosphate isomerase [Trinickia caryophylli]WQE12521.1 S-methyl-5-thioribose-1-phosphate isomerase [Trinickia caryophylli]SMF00054.1 methylthioribose-1-phosphate isomerase [Trinickia caryophylli]GLU30205.1 methylthioribose-1-phosphate isomerase [Trinickia caryophylli]